MMELFQCEEPDRAISEDCKCQWSECLFPSGQPAISISTNTLNNQITLLLLSNKKV